MVQFNNFVPELVTLETNIIDSGSNNDNYLILFLRLICLTPDSNFTRRIIQTSNVSFAEAIQQLSEFIILFGLPPLQQDFQLICGNLFTDLNKWFQRLIFNYVTVTDRREFCR